MSGLVFDVGAGIPGPQGPVGPAGDPGAPGVPGLDGPSGQVALPATFVSAPTNRDAIFFWPPSGHVGPGHSRIVLDVACHKRGSFLVMTDAHRKAVFTVSVFAKLGGTDSFCDVQQNGTWIQSSAPFPAWGGGTTSIAVVATWQAANEWILNITCTGPGALQAPDGCKWIVNGIDHGILTPGV